MEEALYSNAPATLAARKGVNAEAVPWARSWDGAERRCSAPYPHCIRQGRTAHDDEKTEGSMNAEQYARISAPFRARPGRTEALRKADKALTGAFYVLYPLLIVVLIAQGGPAEGSSPLHPLLIPCIVVPGAGFAVATAIRRAVDAPRPYEALAIEPLIHKDTRGRSLPSKHAFSSLVIAFCWLRAFAPMGAALILLACCLGLIRVIGGVHFPRDILAAWALAALCAIALFAW